MNLISEIPFAEFHNSVRICLWSESDFWAEFVFGPNFRRAVLDEFHETGKECTF